MIDDPQENFNVAGESAYAEVGVNGKKEEFCQLQKLLFLSDCGRTEPNVACRVEGSLATCSYCSAVIL